MCDVTKCETLIGRVHGLSNITAAADSATACHTENDEEGGSLGRAGDRGLRALSQLPALPAERTIGVRLGNFREVTLSVPRIEAYEDLLLNFVNSTKYQIRARKRARPDGYQQGVPSSLLKNPFFPLTTEEEVALQSRLATTVRKVLPRIHRNLLAIDGALTQLLPIIRDFAQNFATPSSSSVSVSGFGSPSDAVTDGEEPRLFGAMGSSIGVLPAIMEVLAIGTSLRDILEAITSSLSESSPPHISPPGISSNNRSRFLQSTLTFLEVIQTGKSDIVFAFDKTWEALRIISLVAYSPQNPAYPLGSPLGAPLGSPLGVPRGSPLGSPVGYPWGPTLGSPLGFPPGSPPGPPLVSPLGSPPGSPLGPPLGFPLGPSARAPPETYTTKSRADAASATVAAAFAVYRKVEPAIGTLQNLAVHISNLLPEGAAAHPGFLQLLSSEPPTAPVSNAFEGRAVPAMEGEAFKMHHLPFRRLNVDIHRQEGGARSPPAIFWNDENEPHISDLGDNEPDFPDYEDEADMTNVIPDILSEVLKILEGSALPKEWPYLKQNARSIALDLQVLRTTLDNASPEIAQLVATLPRLAAEFADAPQVAKLLLYTAAFATQFQRSLARPLSAITSNVEVVLLALDKPLAQVLPIVLPLLFSTATQLKPLLPNLAVSTVLAAPLLTALRRVLFKVQRTLPDVKSALAFFDAQQIPRGLLRLISALMEFDH